MNIEQEYKRYCEEQDIPFEIIESVKPYDNTTLFCPAGMQKYKEEFKDSSYQGTRANIQACLRMLDLDEIGDGTHHLYFNMMGLFSFRELTMKQAVNFWMNFIQKVLKIEVGYITVHPNMYEKWVFDEGIYNDWLDKEIKQDPECHWTDGEIGGYCTEFYHNGVEIGNIVNPLGNCIDVGFGLERLDAIVNGTPPPTELDSLKTAIYALFGSGYVPSNKEQGYIMRKLIRRYIRKGGDDTEVPYLKDECSKILTTLENYKKLKPRNLDKSPEWWWDTHGIDVKEFENVKI